VLTLRRRDFVTAVEAFGASAAYNMFRTVLPNAWSPILVQIVVLSSVAILLEAALAFLGVGIPPPTPSWGEMLRTGKTYLYDAPTYAVLPGLVLTLTILSLDQLGRALAAALTDRGHPVDLVPWSRWREAVGARLASGAPLALAPFLGALPERAPEFPRPEFDCTATEAVLGAPPPADRALIGRYLDALVPAGVPAGGVRA